MSVESVLNKFGDPINILDHGFVRVVDVMGDDNAIVQAARVSYGKGTKTVRADKGLIRYLLRHEHMSPFEMCEIKFHCKVPIFVHRQIVRHRTASRNEYSMRYSQAITDYYVPNVTRMNPQDTRNHQSSDESTIIDNANDFIALIDESNLNSYKAYERLIQSGVSREIARTVLPLGMYTTEYWKIDLRNLLHFLKLRLDKHAQYEIREFAKAVSSIVKEWVPYTWEAFEDYVLNSVTFSAKDLQCLKISLCSENKDIMSSSEFEELRDKILRINSK